ncbi:undecaprenyldiphospho-muramoylpentapeptide beta-N-acetylglucosaminyltransferase [Celerinatantimonas diazotrophica]|uniref:UDP-N-acetylglucosamine--N-acetylmuramyl-(pentapeptide) pyrophosphoryl-undecaprenol N-acetylglucosamine transferase n=1 Tax=Celerinatantimonas diazotrophica TaxID=412034 RepID=A0A4R1K1T9_9GAMM|nr:undecaprenyldiphospho-muramoylpentapeptide beta-N-acetylglucosaminyltransferase [Celerinatantimonas diazotrophica]TCK57964.1 UDP-N-acetylglucosamine-N-acetylmuramylpentapeptide N-acetylglucosamine transferase [Celerinatantimonas diazotrophica]CAG9297967.1 UDP-N-acetylglucosamine--N-acetylmuramyl-(pentapeptide) pyrophosphoryl-undecaprenol N-acetylglucosamine transferase [Celerinatantimonas diazotrophica]
MNQHMPHLVVMAGGTGGHVFPGLAVARLMQSRGWKITWLGTPSRMEADLVPRHGFDIEFLDIKGVRGNGLIRKLTAPWKIIRAVMQARSVFKKLRPDVALGMGGFASGPGGIAARMMGIPLVIHEQNAVAGMTNRWLNRFSNRSLVAFPEALPGAQQVGNPVRLEIVEVGRGARIFTNRMNILVIGGSLGARVLNEQLPGAIQSCGNLALQVHHQVGRGNGDSTLQRYRALGVNHAQVDEFIDDMAQAYRWADLVICRAGALTVSELAAAGLPAIFVPLPHAVDDHQTKNARYLADHGAARILPQAQLDALHLSELLQELAKPSVREMMSREALKLAINDATQQVADVCQQMGKK